MTWSVVVPVKRVEWAKTRLRDAVPGVPHESLVLALALDTVQAALLSRTVRRVVVVTDDVLAREAVLGAGALCVPDTPDAGLNPALAHGAAEAARQAPGSGVAVLASDLPALRPEELTAVLRAASAHPRAVVSDATGAGTALLSARPGVELAPAFGTGSAAAHADSGAVPIDGDWPSLRRDVDTATDLEEARALGLGPHTRDLLRERV